MPRKKKTLLLAKEEYKPFFDYAEDSKIEHIEEFEYYYSLNSNTRTTREVAEKFKMSHNTLKSIATRECWVDEVIKRNSAIIKAKQEQIIKDILKTESSYTSLLDKSIKLFEEGIDNGSIKIKNTADLERLIKLRLIMFEAILKIEDIDSLTKAGAFDVLTNGNVQVDVNVNVVGDDIVGENLEEYYSEDVDNNEEEK